MIHFFQHFIMAIVILTFHNIEPNPALAAALINLFITMNKLNVQIFDSETAFYPLFSIR